MRFQARFEFNLSHFRYIFIIIYFLFVLNCATLPESTRKVHSDFEFTNKNLTIVTVNDFSLDKDDGSAFNAGIVAIAKTPRIVTSLPPELKNIPYEIAEEANHNGEIKNLTQVTFRFPSLYKMLEKFGNFDYLLFTHIERSYLRTVFLGITVWKNQAVNVRAAYFDPKNNRILAGCTYFGQVSDDNKLLDLTSAGKSAGRLLIYKIQEK